MYASGVPSLLILPIQKVAEHQISTLFALNPSLSGDTMNEVLKSL
jgi:hypothetical protein